MAGAPPPQDALGGQSELQRARGTAKARPADRSMHSLRMAQHWDAALHRGAAIGVVVLGVAAAILPGFNRATSVALAAFAALAGSYFAIMWLRSRRGRDLATGRWPWLASTIEVSLASVLVAIFALLEGPTLATRGIAVGAYFVGISLAATRFRPRVCVYATGLAVAQYLILFYALVARRLPGDHLVDAVATWERCAWVVAAGAVSAAATSRLRHLTTLRHEEERGRRQVERQLGRYLSRDVAQAILLGEDAAARPQRRHVTVMFCDLRGFTFLCQRERPEDVVELLNVFYERACGIIEGTGGTVNKLLGDGILALFGAPQQLDDHADAALDTAAQIMQMVHQLREQGGVWTHLAVGIGVDTGEVVVGAIGSPSRVEYTAIGSPVNRAARLQSLAERESRRVIVSEATRHAVRGKHSLQSLGSVELKGFAGAETVYALTPRSRANALAESTIRTRREFKLPVRDRQLESISRHPGTPATHPGPDDTRIDPTRIDQTREESGRGEVDTTSDHGRPVETTAERTR